MDVIVGANAIREVLKKRNLRGSILYLLADGKGKSRVLEAIAANCTGLSVVRTDARKLREFSENHKGAVLVCRSQSLLGNRTTTVKDYLRNNAGKQSGLVLILDSISDPQNLGSIIRTSDCFRVDLVVVAKNNAAGISSTVYSISQGALEYVNVAESTNIVRDIEELKKCGYWVYASDIKGKDIYSVDFDSKTAIVMGKEGSGLRRLVAENCDMAVTIPIKGHLDSLNVSVAAGVVLSEFRRKRGY